MIKPATHLTHSLLLHCRSAEDAVLDRDEEAFVAQVRDAVVNELEVEKQRVNAYAIWKEQERQPSAFKRGINSIR